MGTKGNKSRTPNPALCPCSVHVGGGHARYSAYHDAASPGAWHDLCPPADVPIHQVLPGPAREEQQDAGHHREHAQHQQAGAHDAAASPYTHYQPAWKREEAAALALQKQNTWGAAWLFPWEELHHSPAPVEELGLPTQCQGTAAVSWELQGRLPALPPIHPRQLYLLSDFHHSHFCNKPKTSHPSCCSPRVRRTQH